MSSVEEKIKEEVMKVAYGEIDKLYDYMDQHFALEESSRDIIVKQLNKLKDQLYVIAANSRIS